MIYEIIHGAVTADNSSGFLQYTEGGWVLWKIAIGKYNN
jgi:hypothetical protein